MSNKIIDELMMTSTTATDFPECQHLNGWYGYAKFWIFKKRYFVCSDCGKFIERG